VVVRVAVPVRVLVPVRVPGPVVMAVPALVRGGAPVLARVGPGKVRRCHFAKLSR
jgi:hypothetical protein